MVFEKVGNLLRSRGLTLAVAESCTGGLISKMITDVPGSSDYFIAGLVTYSNQAKQRLLGVKEGTLREWGAVSEEVAREMALGACRVTGARLGLSVTGIAGPGGGTPEKPVGLVYTALAVGDLAVVEREIFPGGREEIRKKAAERALALVVRAIEESWV